MTNLSQEAFDVLVKIVDLIEDNNDINGGKWSDWDDSFDIVSHFIKIQSGFDAYMSLSVQDTHAIHEHLETAIDDNSGPFLGVSLV